MQPPKKITLKKPESLVRTSDIQDLPKQQLFENPSLVKEIVANEVMDGETFFPRSIHLEDLDAAFVEYVKGLGLILEGKSVPVYLFSLQRFSEYMQSWGITDQTNHPELPIITITKETPAKQGTMLGAYSPNIPSKETFPLYKIPKIVNGKTIYEYVEIQQPIYVDLQYKINLFANHMRDINEFNEKILQEFRRPQNPLNVFGHNMELKLEDIAENNKTEIEERKYYRHNYVINLRAYLIDEDDFRIKRGLNKINLDNNVCTVKNSRSCQIFAVQSSNCDNYIEFIFNKKSPTTVEYKSLYDATLTHDNQSQLFDNVDYFINNSPSTFPLNISKGDILKINYKKEIKNIAHIKLYGNLNIN